MIAWYSRARSSLSSSISRSRVIGLSAMRWSSRKRSWRVAFACSGIIRLARPRYANLRGVASVLASVQPRFAGITAIAKLDLTEDNAVRPRRDRMGLETENGAAAVAAGGPSS